MTDHKPAPVRRLVTGHDANGRAVIKSDQLIPLAAIPSGDAFFGLLWTAPSLPVDNNDETDGRARDAGYTIKGGSVIRVTEGAPGQVSVMHRTNSIDYGIVISGQVELELDDGVKAVLGPGDIIIQRGTIHAWRNPSKDKWSRIIFVLTEATPYVHKGQPYPEVHAT